MTSERIWPSFDGWCASRSVEPLDLPWDRFLNLTYYFATRNASTESREKFDGAIASAVSAWALAEAREAVQEVTSQAVPLAPRAGRRMPPKPAGWDSGMNTVTAANVMRASLGPRSSRQSGARNQK